MANSQPVFQITPRQQELFELRDFYRGDEWREQDLLFLSQALMLGGMPYKKMKESSYTRTLNTSKGPVTITLKAIKEGVPLPFGKDRVILACALTKARQKGRPWVTFHELEELLATFGEEYQKYGGRDYDLIQDRWNRLNWCVITIRRGDAISSDTDIEGDKKFVISKYRFPKRKRGPKTATPQIAVTDDQDNLCAVQFGADFWADYLKYCVPMPVPLMRLFADQPKAWDICLLVHWASHSAIQSKHLGGTGTKKFAMQDLLQMLGTNDSNPRRLRETIKQVLLEIETVWPEVNALFDNRGHLIVGVPKDEKLLVQPGPRAEEIQALIEDSAKRAAGETESLNAWMNKYQRLYGRFLRELDVIKEAAVGGPQLDMQKLFRLAAQRVGVPVAISDALATQASLKK